MVIHLQFRDKEKLCSYSEHMSEEISKTSSFTVGNSGHCGGYEVVWLGGMALPFSGWIGVMNPPNLGPSKQDEDVKGAWRLQWP